ncbi:BLUF domain-containing protein [Litorimonas sp. WD9-15]|uniref:BLUF domain-containing protein n=1 Tax=Litorimonas sp. WD9-15 TaxID=3418716 RepID=UPI003CFC1651
MIFQLIYTCALQSTVSCQDLAEIAKKSAVANEARNITGMLLCKDGSVLQVLEGQKEDVEVLYDKIQKDNRVTNLIVLLQRMAEKREFPEWSMGYRNASDGGEAFDLSAISMPEALPTEPSEELRTISRTFARVNGISAA